MPRNQGTSRKGKPGKHDREAGMGKALQRAQVQRYRPKSNGSRAGGGGMGMQVGVASIGVVEEQQQQHGTRSVLELNDLDDFLLQADLAHREFRSEKEGLVILDSAGQVYRGGPQVQWADEQDDVRTRRPNFSFTELSVPRRPTWDETTTREELQAREEEAFLEWRRAIAQKEEHLLIRQQQQQQQQQRSLHDPFTTTTVTPFEKNLQVWRQLWRVLERSSCLLQLVDARNPLFYLSQDLREYAQSLGKPMMVLVNKSDYLSPQQRKVWKEYLTTQLGWDDMVFFSAATEQQKLDQLAQEKQRRERQEHHNRLNAIDSVLGTNDDDDDSVEQEPNNSDKAAKDDQDPICKDGVGVDVPLNRQQLIDVMMDFARKHNCQPDARYDNRIQFGMVGFPNVGKSSVINVLMGSSKHTHGLVRVGVAAQPGKTKHFQTLLLPDNEDLMLCDCPGLVFPSFVSNTADLIAAGVYPIAQMRNHWWPVMELICQRIPREILNAQYGIQIPIHHHVAPDPTTATTSPPPPPPTAEEFLQTLCEARGMMAASSGVPDYTRAARMVIQDYAKGKLLYCHAPPNAKDESTSSSSNSTSQQIMYHQETVKTALERTAKLKLKLEKQLAVEEKQQQTKSTLDTARHDEDEDDDVATALDDEDLMDLVAGTTTTTTTTTTTQKPTNHNNNKNNNTLAPPSRRSKRKGGRKKKGRQEDPYGCHSAPSNDVVVDIMDSMLMLDDTNNNGLVVNHGKKPPGVTVNAGKYGRSNYTRPTGPGFTIPPPVVANETTTTTSSNIT